MAAERSCAARAGWILGELILPLPLAVYANHRYLRGEGPEEERAIPEAVWARGETDRLLDRSEARLVSLESKGPGLATVCAIAVAAIAVAIPLTWTDTTTAAKALLVAAGAYTVMSLYSPILLVGPVARATVTAATLRKANQEDDPEAVLAKEKANAAATNDRSILRLANLHAASRHDVRIALFLLFVVWAILLLAGVTNH